MWKAAGNSISMAEGDYGISLPVKVDGVQMDSRDSLRVTITRDGDTILSKDYVATGAAISFALSQSESLLLEVGNYKYSLDWFRSGTFMCNLIPAAPFRVVAK